MLQCLYVLYGGFLNEKRKTMIEKRKDNRKRILCNGESRKSDGRYVYRYYNYFRKSHFLYSGMLCPYGSRFSIPGINLHRLEF